MGMCVTLSPAGRDPLVTAALNPTFCGSRAAGCICPGQTLVNGVVVRDASRKEPQECSDVTSSGLLVSLIYPSTCLPPASSVQVEAHMDARATA